MTLRTLLDVPAPAKINLFLHVVGRRADGHHLLQSVFVLIDWADSTTIADSACAASRAYRSPACSAESGPPGRRFR